MFGIPQASELSATSADRKGLSKAYLKKRHSLKPVATVSN